MSSMRFEGQVVLITGGNSGIGLATAKEFVREGAKVVVTGRDQKTVDATQKELGRDHLSLVSNAASLSGIDQLISKVKERYGRIDTLFINAGVTKFGSFAEMPEDVFDETFAINVKGAYFTIQKALPLFPKSGGTIVLKWFHQCSHWDAEVEPLRCEQGCLDFLRPHALRRTRCSWNSCKCGEPRSSDDTALRSAR